MWYNDLAIGYVPELRPTKKQFENFELYINDLFNDKKYLPYGAVKVW